MCKPTIEPAAPYENLHLVARDYLDRLRQSLDALQPPDDPALRWRNVHTMAQVNARLAQAGEPLPPGFKERSPLLGVFVLDNLGLIEVSKEAINTGVG